MSRLKQYAQAGRSMQIEFLLQRIKQLEILHTQLGRVLPVVQTILIISRS